MAARAVQIPIGGFELSGDVSVPTAPRGLVLFAHGSGSSRLSPRNRAVARALNHAGLATLLLDLLTDAEEEVDQLTHELRFDVELLAERLALASEWAHADPELGSLALGYFGASTGAA